MTGGIAIISGRRMEVAYAVEELVVRGSGAVRDAKSVVAVEREG